ncbi:putative lipopolysaccharide biosynthesis protein [Sulfurospirillum halorespirans DSM 13726]|uniref:Putative lipopolysaccharide biosynthesis protein n=2 Tax=Sulfurospirillum halorespirans TaxID=194424 RepID=A0A1D7TLY4_9BACT|nr:putative lipopolysaccharide biosynthesis protein [Sulfurospirillum halorespirans DSM 13726]
MGFSTILLQFSAHEFAHLRFESDKTLAGSQQNLERLATLLRFAMKWSSGMGILAFPIILAVGFVVLNKKQTDVIWIIPWIIYGIASIVAFINSMLLSFIEGCNSVGEVQKIRFYISFVTVVLTGILLMLDTELYALAISLFIGALSGTIIIFYRYKHMFKQFFILGGEIEHTWEKDTLPLIGRYAVSWISGYFIFSIFTPIAFHYYGIVEAGQIGFSIAICTAIFGIANIWMTIIIPKINIYVARKDYETLNTIFKTHLVLAVFTYLLGASALFIIVIFFRDTLPFSDRLVSPFSLAILVLSWLLQIIINGYAVYMRAHKEEPLMIPSFVSGVYITIATLFIAKYLPFEYFFLGFLSSYLWGMPWVIAIFKRYKKGSL